MIRLKDAEHAIFRQLSQQKKNLLTGALNQLYTTAVVLSKVDILRITLQLLGMEPTDYEPRQCTTMPQIFSKLLFIINKEDASM